MENVFGILEGWPKNRKEVKFDPKVPELRRNWSNDPESDYYALKDQIDLLTIAVNRLTNE